MGQTVSIDDDELGVRVSMRIDTDGPQPRVTSLHLDAADGAAITGDALSLIEALGLTLPLPRHPRPGGLHPPGRAALPANTGSPADIPAPPAVSTPPARTTSSKQRRTRRTGPPPTVHEIAEAFSAHQGSQSAMARQFGCSQSTVSNWLNRHIESGRLKLDDGKVMVMNG